MLAPDAKTSIKRPELALGICLCAAAAARLHAQSIAVTPARVMADEPATIRVAGLKPHEHAILQAELLDASDHSWASQAEFAADDSGAIETSRQAPLKGSYRTISAMGLVWSMMPTAKDAHAYRSPPNFGVQMIYFKLIQDGKPVATAQLQQAFFGASVRQIKLTGAIHGVLFLPEAPGPHPGVLVVGGSEGGLAAARAAWLASHGYAALALAYFHYEDLPKELADIPLEYFGEALSWMEQRPEIDPTRLAVMGTSRGGELALQLGSMYPAIKAVVAYVPANVRYPSCCGRAITAAWTWQGKGLAFAVPSSHGPIPQGPETMAAAIAVERTHGPILVISGDDDGIWSSSSMTDAIANRLKQAHFAYHYERLNYAHAGHRAGMPEIIPAWTGGLTQRQTGESENVGGSTEGNAASSLDAIPRVLEFLRQSFSAMTSN